MNKKLISLLLGIMCMLLTLGIAIQIKTINQMNNKSVTNSATENDLRDSVLKTKEKYDNTYAKVEKLEKELEELQTSASVNSDEANELQEKLKEYKKILGLTEVSGNGLEITLKDGDENQSKSVLSSIVHDGDILQVVNALRNAGADAISVNDQRIVNTSAISCIGNVVKINGEKVGAPYVIKAIGNPEWLYGGIEMNGGYVYNLRRDGVDVEVKKVKDITIPKYEGVFNATYMKTVE